MRAGGLPARSGLAASWAQCTLLWTPLHRLGIMFRWKVKGSQMSCINNHVIEPAPYLNRTLNVKLRTCFIDTIRVKIPIFLATTKNSWKSHFNPSSCMTEKTMWPAAAILLAFILIFILSFDYAALLPGAIKFWGVIKRGLGQSSLGLQYGQGEGGGS